MFDKFKKTNPQEAPHEERDDYPTLRSLVRGYFHQDYDIISDNDDLVVAAFRDENLPATRQRLVDDIQRFLVRYGESEPGLTEAFERVFTPEVDFYHYLGRTTLEGLLKVIEIVSAPATPSYRLPEDQR